MSISQSISPRLQSWLELRGIATSDDPEFARMVPWLRTTFLLCAGLAATATAFASPPFLLTLAVLAGLGSILPVHPFDHIYNQGIRRFTHTRPLPPNGAPTRFACGLASMWLVAIVLAFETGTAWLGYGLGGSFVAVATLVGVTHFCIPSFIYQFVVGDRALALCTIAPRDTSVVAE